MVTTEYFIGKTKYGESEILKLAFDFGWKGVDTRVMSLRVGVDAAVDYLLKKNVSIRTVTIGDATPIKAQDKPADNTRMKVYMGDSIYMVDTKLLGDECWDLQIFGTLGCQGCLEQRKESCNGGPTICDSNKNSLGNEVPVARLIGLRSKRGEDKNDSAA